MKRIVSTFCTMILLLTPLAAKPFHLHDKEAAKLAEEIEKKANALDFTDVLATERANQERLFSSELTTVREYAIARRNADIHVLFSSSDPFSDVLGQMIENRYKGLPQKTALELAVVRDAKADNLEDVRESLQFLNYKVPDCKPGLALNDRLVRDAVGTSDQELSIVRRDLKDFIKACSDYSEAESTFNESVSDLMVELRSTDDSAADLKRDLKKKKKALNELNKKIEEGELEETDGEQRANRLRKDIANGQEKLARLTRFFGTIGAESLEIEIEALSDKVCHIDNVFASQLEQELEDCSSEDELKDEIKAVLTAYPDIAAEIKNLKTLEDAEMVRVLLFQKARLSAEIERKNVQLKRVKERADIQKDIFDQLFVEAQMLLGARVALKDAVRENGDSAVKWEVIYDNKVDIDVRRKLIESTALYLATYVGPQMKVHLNEYRLMDSHHGEILDQAQISSELWQASIQNPVSLISAYHQGGLTKDDFVKLIQALIIALGLEVSL